MVNVQLPMEIEGYKNSVIRDKVSKRYRYIFSVIVLSLMVSMILGIYTDHKYYQDVNNLFIKNIYSSKQDCQEVNRLVRNLPKKVLDILIENKVRIDFTTWEPLSGASGVFRGNDRLIVVQYLESKNDNLFIKYHNKVATLHEIGHGLDYDYSLNRYGYAYSGTNEFEAIYMEEAKNIFSVEKSPNVSKEYLDYFINSRWEYFAECFALYFANEETKSFLKSNALKTYTYIEECIKENKKYTILDYLKEKF